MPTKVEQDRLNLIDMCKQLVSGSTIYNLKGDVSVNGWRARKYKLIKLGVIINTKMYPGRGYGTPFYTLGESLESTIQKIDCKKPEQKEKEKRDRRNRTRNDPGCSGRFAGYGIESWLFMTSDCANEYMDWCYDWTDPAQRRRKWKNGKKKGKAKNEGK